LRQETIGYFLGKVSIDILVHCTELFIAPQIFTLT